MWDLCNSGQHTTWYAARSDDPLENLARTHLYPAPGETTFARLTRRNGRYRMHVARGRFETCDTVPGDFIAELRAVCEMLDVDFEGLGDAAE